MKIIDVFINSTADDANVAYEIGRCLETAGYKTWSLHDNLIPGPSNYVNQSEQALRNARAVLVVISPRAHKSRWALRDLTFAHALSKPLLPILFDVSYAAFQDWEASWREPLKDFTSIEISADRISDAVPRIISGLEAFGITPSSPRKKADTRPTLPPRSDDYEYDAFLSYRREAGSEPARLIQSELAHRDVRVFLDVDDLRSGHFDDKLLDIIRTTANFILILSPGCLERCKEPLDWLRREVVCAIESSSNIIPLMMPGFTFPKPQEIQEEIRPLARHHCINWSHEFFEAMITKIMGYMKCALGKSEEDLKSWGQYMRAFAVREIRTGNVPTVKKNTHIHNGRTPTKAVSGSLREGTHDTHKDRIYKSPAREMKEAPSLFTTPESQFEMNVEDVFAIRNRGTTVTGAVLRGTITPDTDLLLINKKGEKFPVKLAAIEKFRKLVPEAIAGDNVGLIFKKEPKSMFSRGDRICSLDIQNAASPAHSDEVFTGDTPLEVDVKNAILECRRWNSNERMGHVEALHNKHGGLEISAIFRYYNTFLKDGGDDQTAVFWLLLFLGDLNLPGKTRQDIFVFAATCLGSSSVSDRSNPARIMQKMSLTPDMEFNHLKKILEERPDDPARLFEYIGKITPSSQRQYISQLVLSLVDVESPKPWVINQAAIIFRDFNYREATSFLLRQIPRMRPDPVNWHNVANVLATWKVTDVGPIILDHLDREKDARRTTQLCQLLLKMDYKESIPNIKEMLPFSSDKKAGAIRNILRSWLV